MFADDLPKSDSAEMKVKDELVRINEGRKRFIEMELSHKFTTKANGNPASFPKKIIQRINFAINFNDVKHSRFSIWFRSYAMCGLSAASLNRIEGKMIRLGSTCMGLKTERETACLLIKSMMKIRLWNVTVRGKCAAEVSRISSAVFVHTAQLRVRVSRAASFIASLRVH